MNATQGLPTREAIDIWLEELRRARAELDEVRRAGLPDNVEAIERAWKRYYRILMAPGGLRRP